MHYYREGEEVGINCWGDKLTSMASKNIDYAAQGQEQMSATALVSKALFKKRRDGLATPDQRYHQQNCAQRCGKVVSFANTP